MAAFPLQSREALHPFLPSLQGENRTPPKLCQAGTMACGEGSGENHREKIREKIRKNQGPAGSPAWHGCSETISAVMYTDRVCHSLKSSREKKGHSCLSCCQGYIIGECFGKTTAGKGKLQPEAQICESLSECSAGIACKEHTLESVKSDTTSPQLFLWLWGSFSVPVGKKILIYQNTWSDNSTDQTTERKNLQMFQGPKQQLQSKYINEIKRRFYLKGSLVSLQSCKNKTKPSNISFGLKCPCF